MGNLIRVANQGKKEDFNKFMKPLQEAAVTSDEEENEEVTMDNAVDWGIGVENGGESGRSDSENTG